MANFGILQPAQSNAQPLLGQAPALPEVSSGGDDGGGIGEFFKGLSGLLGGVSTPQASVPQEGSSSANPINSPTTNQGIINQAVNPASLSLPTNQGSSQNKLFDLAKQYLGQNELKNAPTLMSFFQKSGVDVDPKSTPWCAGFVNAVIQSNGGQGTGSLAARSFLNWGQPTEKPTPGDIVVLSRGDDPTKGHTGFFAGYDSNGGVKVLGGNQGPSGEVSMASYDPQKVLGFRRPPTGTQIQNTIVPNAHPELATTMKGISHVESQGAKNPYSLVGPATKNGNRALGKYQIMQSNLGPWSKEAIGRRVSQDEFLNNPTLQEQIAGFHLNKSLKAGYSPEDTASIWFSGRPQSKAGKSRDVFGTTVPQYIKKFNEGRGADSRPMQNQGIPGINQPTNPTRSINPLPEARMQLASSMNPNMPPNIPAFSPQKPIRELSPEEIRAIMRWNGNYRLSS